jgi:hypothetical protein
MSVAKLAGAFHGPEKACQREESVNGRKERAEKADPPRTDPPGFPGQRPGLQHLAEPEFPAYTQADPTGPAALKESGFPIHEIQKGGLRLGKDIMKNWSFR